MCGICGYARKELWDMAILKKMNDTMKHRGPDDSGEWSIQTENYAVGLAHRRLSILDLSPLGHQPMLSQDKTIALVFNGEIYNYKDLRIELSQKGYSFFSECDTEVIIAAYKEWKEKCFAKFNGMFAIAIYNYSENKIILARDRIGKKPLYYYFSKKKGEIIFASELKPIMCSPYFEKVINKDSIAEFMCNKSIVAPNTIFENTYKLVAGTFLEFELGKEQYNIKINQYWDILEKKNVGISVPVRNYEECKGNLKNILSDSVQKRMIADVPLGTFLSGGIDSTLVTAMAQQKADRQVETFAIGFNDKHYNEAPYAAEIAKQLNTKHREFYVGETEIFKMIEQLAYYYDEPFSDSSQLPTMLVCQKAKEYISVALSGDGGDELFCGYEMYDWTAFAQRVDFLGDVFMKLPFANNVASLLPAQLRAFLKNRDNTNKTQFYIDIVIEEVNKILGRNVSALAKYDYEKKLEYSNWQERRMILDLLTYLPDEILTKMDRASMKYSLEVRCPILDFRVIENSFAIPHEYKYFKRDKKHILKDIVYDFVPHEYLDRPKKGFGVPLCKWLRTTLKDSVEKYANEAILRKQDIFVPQEINNLLQKQQKYDEPRYSAILWSFYVFQMWYQEHIENLWES